MTRYDRFQLTEKGSRTVAKKTKRPFGSYKHVASSVKQALKLTRGKCKYVTRINLFHFDYLNRFSNEEWLGSSRNRYRSNDLNIYHM